MEQTRQPGQMKRQESFERFFAEFVTGGKGQCREADNSGTCVYRDSKGNGCAIGIQPEFMAIYRPNFEAAGIDTLYQEYESIRGIIHKDDLAFFAGLQELHDGELQHGMKRLMLAIKEFAADYNVLIPDHTSVETKEGA